MSRISLEEAYNNRDVIAWLVRNSRAIDELQNILKDIDPNGDLTNVVTKTGDQVIDGNKTFIGQITADCDIIQNGGAYETHAEQVYSHNDYMIMRDGALNGLAAGQYSGLQVQKYDGATNARMCLDNTGVMRVGDINDEQPIATRDESGSMTDAALVVWDAANQKITAPAANVGDDLHPVKIVGGEPTPITLPAPILTTQTVNGCYIRTQTLGKIVLITCQDQTPSATGDNIIATGLTYAQGITPVVSGTTNVGILYGDGYGNLYMRISTVAGGTGFRCVAFLA